MKFLFPAAFVWLIVHFEPCTAQKYPAAVEKTLKLSGSNAQELRKALNYFYRSGDALKISSIYFLVANMPLHRTITYNWYDNKGQKVDFSELNYKTFNDAVTAFNGLKSKHGPLHPLTCSYNDVDSIKASFLIENIDLAVAQYKNTPADRKVSEKDFFEYLLPYRISVEPLQEWRKEYARLFASLSDEQTSPDAWLRALKTSINSRFSNIWAIENRSDPIPCLGAGQILLRGKGYCEDMADMAVFISRSNGIAASVDNIPEWATTSGNHFLNFIVIDKKSKHFDAAQDSLGREPSKVLRTTYSPQQDAIATHLDTADIPRGFLRIKNYIDVTADYWPTGSVPYKREDLSKSKGKVLYVAVYNGGAWKPVWYGFVQQDAVVFKNMSRGVVYLPVCYEKGRLTPASWPYALGYNHESLLKPDLSHGRTVNLDAQERHLKFQPGKTYSLYYWDSAWRLLGIKKAPDKCIRMSFDNVPANALLVLVPEYSRKKERPFTITANGTREWW